MIYRVGITGGIGSGKSTVAKVFEVLGIPTYFADDAAKRVMNEHTLLKQQIIKEFGEESYTVTGLNRKYIASIVFNDPAKLATLNSIVHPATLQDAEEWMQRQTTPYAIKEAALIFESGAQAQLDFVIGVYTPAHIRIQRVMKRDNITREEVKARMDKQIDEAMKMRLCDYIINNDDQQMVLPQVMELHELLLTKAKENQLVTE